MSSAPTSVRLTWMSIANWLIEIGDLRLLMDAYYTRPPRPGPDAPRMLPSDRAAVTEVLEAIGYEQKPITHVLIGHSHSDHALDAPLVTEMSGATLVGSQTTLYQAQAQSIPDRQLRLIKNQDVIQLDPYTTVYVAELSHSFQDALKPEARIPKQLHAPPKLEPPTTAGAWDLREHFPNGGGSWAFIFKVDTGNGRHLSICWMDSGAAFGLDEHLIVEGEDCGTPRANLTGALAKAGLEGVDLWTAPATVAGLPEAMIPILRPRYFIPNHHGDNHSPIRLGLRLGSGHYGESSGKLPAKYAKACPHCLRPGASQETFTERGVKRLTPEQYMDAWVLDRSGVRAVPNPEVKRALGLEEAQPVPA